MQGLPLFVHCRERDANKGPALGAYTDLLAVLRRHPALLPERIGVHCFTGDVGDMQMLVAAGYLLGLTCACVLQSTFSRTSHSNLTAAAAGFVAIVKRADGTIAALQAGTLPLAQLLFETDAPFMAPDKVWLPAATGLGLGRKNEPAAMPAVCRAVAVACGQEAEEVAAVTTANAKRFFRFE